MVPFKIILSHAIFYLVISITETKISLIQVSSQRKKIAKVRIFTLSDLLKVESFRW